MEAGSLAIIKAHVNRQMEMIEQIYDKIYQRKGNYKENEEKMESIAYQLHNLYCAFEDLMKIISDEFENRITERTDWHIRLLTKMTEDIPGIRPAVFSRESFPLLDELRSFRHWFRHAYSYRIEQEKLEIVLRKTIELRGKYRMDIQNFSQKLCKKEVE